MSAAGLIRREMPEKPSRLCITGRVLTGAEPNGDGSPLPADDLAWLVATAPQVPNPRRELTRWAMAALESGGFHAHNKSVSDHINGRCICPDGPPLHGCSPFAADRRGQ
jgi:hypothetical protein